MSSGTPSLVPAFIPPMLSCRLTDQRLLADAHYIVEPKLDGRRAEVHVVAGGRHRVLAWPAPLLLTAGPRLSYP
jgi:ATP-dependent DNA ligase